MAFGLKSGAKIALKMWPWRVHADPSLKTLFLLVSLPFLSTLAMIGQSGSVRGSILDPSGAAVAGTHITLSGHGAARTTTSDASGNYQFSSLDPGTYTLTVEASGFGHYENSSIHVSKDGVLQLRSHAERCRSSRVWHAVRGGLKVAALNNRVMMTAAAFHVMRNNVFFLVSDIPVFNDQLTQGSEGTVEVALNHRWSVNANATGMHGIADR